MCYYGNGTVGVLSPFYGLKSLRLRGKESYSHERSAMIARKASSTAVIIIIVKNFLVGNMVMNARFECKYPGKVK
jgi:hypothetical protein